MAPMTTEDAFNFGNAEVDGLVAGLLGLHRDAPADEPMRSVDPGPATNVPTFENRVTATVGAGRETLTNVGQNSSSPANTFEARYSQGGVSN